MLAVTLVVLSTSALAQDRESAPPRRDFTLPIEIDGDFGAENGDAVISRYVPLISFPLGQEWRLISLTLAVLADAPGGVPGRPGNPEPGPGDHVFGLGDLTQAVLFTPPARSERFVWGFGPAFVLPIATDDRLGSGKWSLGPGLRVTYRPGSWNLGVLVANLSSVAGDSDRADINQLLIRGFIRRDLGGAWYFTSAPMITANWNASSGQKWLVPVGGGIGRGFQLASKPVALAVHGYVNAVKPEGAPDWLLRLDLILPVPVALRQ